MERKKKKKMNTFKIDDKHVPCTSSFIPPHQMLQEHLRKTIRARSSLHIT